MHHTDILLQHKSYTQKGVSQVFVAELMNCMLNEDYQQVLTESCMKSVSKAVSQGGLSSRYLRQAASMGKSSRVTHRQLEALKAPVKCKCAVGDNQLKLRGGQCCTARNLRVVSQSDRYDLPKNCGTLVGQVTSAKGLQNVTNCANNISTTTHHVFAQGA